MGIPAEYGANITNFVSTVVVSNFKGTGRTARMNSDAYLAERDGEVLEGPTQPPPTLSVMDAPLKNPRLDQNGNPIAEQHSPVLRA
jgi:hypothetical protein